MNYLIIPDVHNHVEGAEALIAAFPGRLVIFLGDYFDDYNDTVEDARRTAEWLRYSINKGRIHLMGNHDLPYRWPGLTCPGWTKEKHKVVSGIMTAADWRRVRLCIILRSAGRPLVISHAGITLANLYGVADPKDTAKGGRLEHLRDRSVDEHLSTIDGQRELCDYWAEAAGEHHWLNQGSRVGHRNVAGPFWLDRHEFDPISGIDQVMGHTHVDEPQCHYASDSENWFIDGAGKFAALIDDGVVQPIWATPGKLGEKAD